MYEETPYLEKARHVGNSARHTGRRAEVFNVPVLGNKYALRHLSAWKCYHSTSSRVGVGNKCAVYHFPLQSEPLPAFHTVNSISWGCGCGIMHTVWNSKFGVGTAECRSSVSRVWWSKSGTPVLTEQLVTEGN